MRERFVLKSDKGYLKPEYDLPGSGIGYTNVPGEASRFVTVEVACAIAREISVEEKIEVEMICV